MPKVIQNLELLKKLQPYIKKSEYSIFLDKDTWNYIPIDSVGIIWDSEYICKTLTKEETMDFMSEIWMWQIYANLIVAFSYTYWDMEDIELIEKILNYLINNNLMEEWKQN